MDKSFKKVIEDYISILNDEEKNDYLKKDTYEFKEYINCLKTLAHTK